MSTPHPIVALLTDFGTRDYYVASMKGVVLDLCPDAALVDISHEIPPQDVLAGALTLEACYRDFPAGAIYLVVVDPGVGSSRRRLAAEAGGYRFVAPDNGVLAGVFADAPPDRLVELSGTRYARPTISRTFEGRDLFAPAAGWLARGLDLTSLGPPIGDYLRLDIPAPAARSGELCGEVLLVDRFGNLITNISREGLAEWAASREVAVRAGGRSVGRIVSTYAEVERGALCALFGSTGRLEVSVNSGSAADRLSLGRGAEVVVSLADEAV
jgi:S-adenosyl-L-methionine hydrolase (adenosine-forming)